MIPDTIATALVAGSLGWLAYCFRQWDSFADHAEEWIRRHDEEKSSNQSGLLRTVLAFTLTDLVTVYLRITAPEDHPAVNRDRLRATVESIDADPAIHDVRIREDITKPILTDVISRINDRLPTIVPEVVVQPDVLEGVQALGCYAVDVARFRRRKATILLRYPLQVGLLGLWLAGLLASYLALTPLWTIDAAIASGILPVIHGLELEVRRLRLKGELRESR